MASACRCNSWRTSSRAVSPPSPEPVCSVMSASIRSKRACVRSRASTYRWSIAASTFSPVAVRTGACTCSDVGARAASSCSRCLNSPISRCRASKRASKSVCDRSSSCANSTRRRAKHDSRDSESRQFEDGMMFALCHKSGLSRAPLRLARKITLEVLELGLVRVDYRLQRLLHRIAAYACDGLPIVRAHDHASGHVIVRLSIVGHRHLRRTFLTLLHVIRVSVATFRWDFRTERSRGTYERRL